MKTSSLILVIILMFTFTAYLAGQEVQRADTSSFAGKKAFTFSFDNLNLGSGLGFGGTFWFNNDWALRVLLSGTYSSNIDLENSNGNNYNGSVKFTAYIKRHFHPIQRLSPYVGTGIGIGYEQSEYFNDNEPDKSGNLTVPLIVGAEYWVTDNISFSGEQRVSFNLSVSHYVRIYSISSSTSSLLLSVYF